jgi:hypothetical protein
LLETKKRKSRNQQYKKMAQMPDNCGKHWSFPLRYAQERAAIPGLDYPLFAMVVSSCVAIRSGSPLEKPSKH